MNRTTGQALLAFTTALLLAPLAVLHAADTLLVNDGQPRAAEIPFPTALEAAAVAESRVSDINREALLLGNGDLNGLLWDRNGTLCLRVTKNDVWDARIDTSQDPPLLRMDIRKRTWKGGTRAPASWHKHPYPQPRCGAVVVIGTSSAQSPAWTCIRSQGPANDWRSRKGLAVMSVAGRAGVSAGYRLDLAAGKATVYSGLRLRLSGTPNARYFANVRDAAGKDLARSGWRKTPAKDQEVTLAFSAERRAANTACVVLPSISMGTPASMSTLRPMSCPLRSLGRRYSISVRCPLMPDLPRATAPMPSVLPGGLKRGPTTIGKTNSYQPSTQLSVWK